MASIAPTIPIEIVSPIPEPSQYIFHYVMQYSSSPVAAVTFDPRDFYSAPLTANERYTQGDAPTYQGARQPFLGQTQSQLQLTKQNIGSVKPTLSLIDMFQLTDDDTAPSSSLTGNPHPQRRLAMLINDWRVSASAHLPLLHPHDVGASVKLQHSF
jgi:hypothetical protein